MANFRQIHVSIWKDEWFLELETDEKLLFVYFFSNENTSLSGLYKLALKVISFETGIDKERILEILAKFSQANKIHYQSGIVWVVKMRKYHETRSTKVQARILYDIKDIPDCELKRRYIAYYTPDIPYRYPMDTKTQLKEEEDNIKEEEEEKESPPSRSSSIFPDVILCNASGLSAFPADQLKWVDVIIRLAEDHGIEDTTAAMKRACERWTSTVGKNKQPYRKTNLTWINWAQEELANDGKPPAIDPSKPMTDAEFVRYHKLGKYAEEP